MQGTPEHVAADWLDRFVSVISDGVQLDEVFIANSLWRDLLVFTANYRTIEYIDRIT
ncbi:hypothetical protein NEOLEDRAFT_1135697 [Neolentinus lepideus HHB14362 ss-1]|uniref:Uncharacterized protein n=1 Tax=Neolentinus lepideus HHB14362 ss-1 TaxID=1314782 RepID=A0A165RQL4_9AGAM|nr:hypothetical protein NEOLEDRAFT_1135697 [Neolentinus lepideus HHB14362 ss-1]